MARAGYRDAKNRGDHEEEARWANQMGHLLKERGEYVEALKWFRIDYDLSLKHLPQKQLMPTCQSIGEMYLRLERFQDALIYQKKHLEFAQEVDDLVEQQRASTQLGRTFFDIYEKDEGNYSALENAKNYLNISMDLARTLKEDAPSRNSSSFVKELVDAYNNMGLLKIYLEDYRQAERVLLDGLRICDEEEVGDNDEGRTRLHHNLGRIYIEKKEWEKAKEHVNTDIAICQNIPHPQGEANGLINLGLIHYKLQKYEDALLCYNKALRIAHDLEDEDALVQNIKINIQTTEEAKKIMNDLVQEEQHLKKLSRSVSTMIATTAERKYQLQLQQYKSLKQLIELAINIEAWPKHLEFAKRSKNIVKELVDKEKLSDALLEIGEAYYNLCKYDKAKKWFTKSWIVSKSIGNIEGQAIAKINLGNVLDSTGEWAEALEAYQEGYKTAVQGKVLSSQLTALQNMHYSYMLRFDNLEDARELEADIESLKKLVNEKGENKDSDNERCSETDSEEGNCVHLSDNNMEIDSSPADCPSEKSAQANHLCKQRSDKISGPRGNVVSIEDDIPLASYLRSCKEASWKRTPQQKMGGKNECQKQSIVEEKPDSHKIANDRLPAKVNVSEQSAGRKRSRMVLSDDEKSDDMEEGIECHTEQQEGSLPSEIGDAEVDLLRLSHEEKKSPLVSKNTQSSAGHSSYSQRMDKENTNEIGNLLVGCNQIDGKLVPGITLNVKHDNCRIGKDIYHHENHAVVPVRIGETIVMVDARGSNESGLKTINWLKTEVVQLFCLQLYNNNKSSGKKPVVQKIVYRGNILESDQLVEDLLADLHPGDTVDAVIDGWVQITFTELYLIFCKDCNQTPNPKLLNKCYSRKLQFLEEYVASDCELEDVSVLPLLKALGKVDVFTVLDLSHNSLGSQTMHNIQESIVASKERGLSLTLDLHDNQLGASALLQICKCPVSLSRLAVLNLSGNHLTDACARYISTVVEECKSLQTLNLEDCALTSRTIQSIGHALPQDSPLEKLSIGKNSPISGNAMAGLLKKLSMLPSFQHLDITNVELNEMSIESLCHLLQSSSILSLAIGGTHIGVDGALELSRSLAKTSPTVKMLDMSFCWVDPSGGSKLFEDIILLKYLVQLDLSGNQLEEWGADVLGHLVAKAGCKLKILMLNRCHLGKSGILKIIESLSENRFLEELGLAGNNIVFNIVAGAKKRPTERCVEEVVNTLDYHCECSDSRASNRGKQHESPTFSEHTPFCDCASSKDCNSGAKDQKSQSLRTGFETNPNQTTACFRDKTENAEDRGLQQSCQQHERNCGEYDVADSEDEGRPKGVNHHRLEDDCASSSQPLSLRTNENVLVKRETKAIEISFGEYASELISAIQKANYLQLLDLSENSLPSEMVEQLYVAWSSNTRVGTPVKHIENQVVHFSMEGRRCCGLRPCCRSFT